MARSMQSTTNPPSNNSFFIGWFQFPIDIDANVEAIELTHDILVGISLLLNPVLLWTIVKNPGAKSWSNTSILVASICVGNIVMNCTGLIRIVEKLHGGNVIGQQGMTTVLSVFMPKYYASTFLLALNNYALIVEPLRYKTLAPKCQTAVLITLLIWLGIAVVFIVAPLLVDDFASYVKVMMTVVVSLCWILTLIIMAMYMKIVNTLSRRKTALKGTLNVASSRQGFRLIKQNTKLAKLMFTYIAMLVLLSLPLYTSIILIMNCPQCGLRANLTFCIHMIPISMCIPILHAFHWLFGTPQYFKEIKRLGLRVLLLCGISKKN